MAILAAAQATFSQLTVKTGLSEDASKPTVMINIPDTIPSDKIEMRYFLSGEFGGYGDYVHHQKDRHSYEIVAALNGKPAGGIKIIAYSPGCAFKTYEFRFEEIREAQADFVCDLASARNSGWTNRSEKHIGGSSGNGANLVSGKLGSRVLRNHGWNGATV